MLFISCTGRHSNIDFEHFGQQRSREKNFHVVYYQFGAGRWAKQNCADFPVNIFFFQKGSFSIKYPRLDFFVPNISVNVMIPEEKIAWSNFLLPFRNTSKFFAP